MAKNKEMENLIKSIVKNSNTNPRRFNLAFCSISELAIKKAMQEVEKLGADDKLTEAIMLLTDAHTIVSDFIDKSINTLK